MSMLVKQLQRRVERKEEGLVGVAYEKPSGMGEV